MIVVFLVLAPVHEVEEPSETSVVIRRDGRTDKVVTLKYQTVDGSASSVSGDYDEIRAGQVTFNIGEVQKTVIIHVLDDSVAEGPETFFLQVYEIIGTSALLFVKSCHSYMTLSNYKS